jgi:hypothetical protein
LKIEDSFKAFDIDNETYAMMSAHTDELAGMFDKEQQRLLIWSSVMLSVTHGPNTCTILARDVGAMLQKYAAPGKYKSTVPPAAARCPADDAEEVRLSFDQRVECQCLSAAGQQPRVRVQCGRTVRHHLFEYDQCYHKKLTVHLEYVVMTFAICVCRCARAVC